VTVAIECDEAIVSVLVSRESVEMCAANAELAGAMKNPKAGLSAEPGCQDFSGCHRRSVVHEQQVGIQASARISRAIFSALSRRLVRSG